MKRHLSFVTASVIALVGASAAAQETPAPAADSPAPSATDTRSPAPLPPAPSSLSPLEAPAPPPAPAAAAAATPPGLKVTPLGYVEAYGAWNFNRPSNGITNFRGFDNRHSTFSLANVALGAQADVGPVGARLILQYGSTPSTYYLGEPSLPGAGGANASNSELWKYVQEANVTWKAPVGKGLALTLGLIPSPIGYEVFAVKENWNWSRSNLFFGFPYYHTGLRASYDLTDEVSATVAVLNGWNSAVDNNEEKSFMAYVGYKKPDLLTAQVLYMGGIERPTGSPEGPNWRHHFDAFAQLDATTFLSFVGQADYGWEKNRIGNARWWAGALYARVKPVDRVFVVLRGDRFTEHLATDGTGRISNPIFFGGSEWVSSVTATLDVRPHDNLSIRFEGRHDVSEAPLYFGRNVQGDGSSAKPYVPNGRTQSTLTLGATAWF
jgi:hypothetical protein